VAESVLKQLNMNGPIYLSSYLKINYINLLNNP
jgi:hypothetical protein